MTEPLEQPSVPATLEAIAAALTRVITVQDAQVRREERVERALADIQLKYDLLLAHVRRGANAQLARQAAHTAASVVMVTGGSLVGGMLVMSLFHLFGVGHLLAFR